MTELEREIIELKHQAELNNQSINHAQEENDAEHHSMAQRISEVRITIDGHEVRISALEGKGVQMKAKAVDHFFKWLIGVIATLISGAVIFILGSYFGKG